MRASLRYTRWASRATDALMTLTPHIPLPRNLPGSVRGALALHWGALLALALFLVAGLVALDDYGVTYDEYWQRALTALHLRYLIGDVEGFLALRHADHLYGVAFEAPLLFVERAFSLSDARDIHLVRHLFIHLTFLIGGLFAYMLAYRLFGGRLLAVGAMLLFLLHPRLYAHSFFNTKDIPFLVLFMIALFLAHRAFRRDTVSAFVLLGVGVGLLVNIRVMGVVLLAAVPALRALDFASGWAERKRILVSAGAFALASGLAVFASLPYLWGNPIRRAIEWWTVSSEHPTTPLELFRGTLYRSVDFPVEYLPVWLSISSPPFALLLGALGAAGILALAVRGPRKALRSESLRFGLLAAGGFAAPVAGAILLDANIYNGWRQMFFLWAPFALLGAFGLRWLMRALGQTRFRMAAVCGAAGAGFAATALSMALIHPNQQDYFTFLVDRVAPERLRSQYEMNYWDPALWQGLQWIIEQPAEPLAGASAITGSHATPARRLDNAMALPESARERVADAAPFDFVSGERLSSWSRSARELHRVKVYANTLMIVESRDDLREVYESVRGREPALDAAFEVHRIDGALALVMEPCVPAFVERVSVILRAFPVDAGDLPPWREGKPFEPRYFALGNYGAYFERKCVASLPLPAYPVADFELRWGVELLDAAEAREKARRARDDGRMLARAEHRAAYDVYLADGELAYLNDSCDPPETDHPFHLNVYPERVGDLPEERRERGYERFHFEFLLNGALSDGGCVVLFRLPDYPVAAIQTGQRDGEGGNLWLAEFWIDPERRLAKSAAGASGEPVARGVFDVHLTDGALVYVKEPCEAADTEYRFFLHITPERVSDLPDERRERGFDNLDFAFFPNGALFAGRCAARAALPEYAVASIRTGQYAGGVGEVWSVEFAVGK